MASPGFAVAELVGATLLEEGVGEASSDMENNGVRARTFRSCILVTKGPLKLFYDFGLEINMRRW